VAKGINQGRRRVLKIAGGLALSSIVGCCKLRPFPSNEINVDIPKNEYKNLNPILRPSRVSNFGKPLGIKYCLDAHAHFFNASDVNVAGYLKGPVAHTIKNKDLREFLIAMIPLVEQLANNAPKAHEEYEYLYSYQKRHPELANRKQLPEYSRHLLDMEADIFRDKLANTLFQEMTKRKLDIDYIKLQSEYRSRLGILKGAPERFSKDTVLNALDPTRRLQQNLLYKNTQAPNDGNEEPGGILEFVGHMLSYRWMALRTYQRFYTEDDKAFGIDGVFGALVDFDYFLDCPPRSSREDQVKLQSLLSWLSGGYMLPLVGYNPWTDIKRDDESLNLVKRAITDYGFVGVKIYPPIGYFPYGNDKLNVDSSLPRPDLAQLDGKLEKLFSWCAENSIPVMAHTGESMGRDDASDEFANPEGWKLLFEQFKGKNPPFINAGHFGGDEPKDPQSNSDWPKEYAKLAKDPTGIHFYGDLGYWSALTKCTPMTEDCKTAIERIKGALNENPMMKSRIMFGTDWFMLSKEQDWASYPRYLAQNLKDILPADALFYRNTLDCFGLGKSGDQRMRVLAYFKQLKGGFPEWLRFGEQ
jgi:predicted TIM-barrel fold metal-dependent hydrolase